MSKTPTGTLNVKRETRRVELVFDGHVLDVLALVAGDKQSGTLTVKFNQGEAYFVSFDRVEKRLRPEV
ncbi:MAG: hypothetical protein M3416_01320 [Acidobacteriota bacterium]|nr:hypothetical protein [Acidobacteriota bacterium]